MSVIEQRSSTGTAAGSADEGGDSFVTSDGVRLYVRATGPVAAEVTVVLVHCWTQDHTSWEPVVAGLPAGVRVLRYDHRGHGASDAAPAGTRSIEQFADDLADVIEHRAPDGKLVLAGHSLGGMVIMALAERQPGLVADRVAGVAFVATSSGDIRRISLGLKGALGRSVPRVEPLLRALLEKRKKGKLPGNPRLLAPAARWLVFGKRANRADMVTTVRQALNAHPPTVGKLMDAMFAHDRKVCLKSLRDIPTVVLVGDRDRLCPVEHARAIADGLEQTEFVLFPEAGHMLNYERPAEVATHIRRLVL